jgi:histidinol-phosphate/aromatic aminotransferase/cobyric acid decarboxylase-like protein
VSEDSTLPATISDIYQHLAYELDDAGDGTSLSGYQCENPFVEDLLRATQSRTASIDYRRYTYFDADEVLSKRIRTFHDAVDGKSPEAIVSGSGATPLLVGLASYLRGRGVSTVFYVPPLYFALRIALERFGIIAVPVADRHHFETGFHLTLPADTDSCMLVADPVWYSGTPLSHEVVSQLADWQRRTQGMICVDGSMQYMQWEGRMAERSASLNPALTIRLVCPTKQLAVHGYRFAYFIAPRAAARALAWSCATVSGAASADSLAFAHEAMEALVRGHIPRQVVDLAAHRYGELNEARIIDSEVEPRCGHMAFARINAPIPPGHVLLGEQYFEQTRFPSHFKVNLLSPSIELLMAKTGRMQPYGLTPRPSL